MHKRHDDSLSSKEGSIGSAIKPGVHEHKRDSCTLMYMVDRKVKHRNIFD